MLISKENFKTFLREKNEVFYQHQYAVLKGSGHLVTYGLASCLGVFIHGKDSKGNNVGVGIHIGMNQARTTIDQLMKEIKQSGAFQEITSCILVGGDYGMTPPFFRGSRVADKIKTAAAKHLSCSPVHLYYNQIGNLDFYPLLLPFLLFSAHFRNLIASNPLTDNMIFLNSSRTSRVFSSAASQRGSQAMPSSGMVID